MAARRVRRAPLHLGEALGRVLTRAGLAETAQLIAIAEAWPAIVGASAAVHCWPEALRHGSLVVATPHPAWKQELHYRQGEILEEIAKRLPRTKIIELAFLLRPTPASVIARTPDEAAQRFGALVASAVGAGDPTVRDAIARAAAAHAQLRRR